MFRYLLLLLAIFIIPTITEAAIGLKHYEISLFCNKNKVVCERIRIKYTYTERDKNIQSFPGVNTYKINMVSFAGRTLKTLYFSVDKKASSNSQGFTTTGSATTEKQNRGLYIGDSLLKVKRKVKQEIEKQAIEDERLKILNKQQVILHIPYIEDASRMDIYNTVGQKIQTIRLDGIIK
ncbi:MAG: hypothetical protein ABH886_03220 [Candidatus Desantisbacteria bacterium]